jgi:hypothetical protein
MRIEDQQTRINNYWLDDIHIGHDDDYHVPVQVGEGLFISALGRRRFRVMDIWYNGKKHGVFDIRRHISRREVTSTSDDVLRDAATDYSSASRGAEHG